MYWYFRAFFNFTNFRGRAQRKEYWVFTLLNLFVLGISMLIDLLLKTTFHWSFGYSTLNLPFGYAFLFFALAMAIPSIAVTVRRLHDVGKSGWNLLVLFIPLLGIIRLFDLVTSESNFRNNMYGSLPRENDLQEESENYQYN